jgi:hypothetical protein
LRAAITAGSTTSRRPTRSASIRTWRDHTCCKEQIEACHARGIRVPIYTTIQWDHFTALQHPEWLCSDENGRIVGTPPFEAGFYRELNVNSPYIEEFIKPHVAEIMTMLPCDGFFFDIVRPIAFCRSIHAGARCVQLDSTRPTRSSEPSLRSIRSTTSSVT